MNVLLVTSFLDLERGAGTAERTRHLALHLAGLGCKLEIVAMAGTAWLDEFERAGISVLLTGYSGDRFPIPWPKLVRVWRVIRQADVIHVMGYWYLLAAVVCSIANLAGKPFALCPAGELAPAFRGQPWKGLYYYLFGRTMIAHAASIIATTSRERDEIIRTERVTANRIMISPNGIASAPVLGKCNIALPAKPFILFVGRLTAIKGPDLLVDAFAKISVSARDLRLIIAGPDSGMRTILEARVQSIGLQGRVAFLGFVDETARQHLYKNAAFLVIPSRSEVMSMVALEAGAMGTPVLLTDCCGFDEVQKVGGGIVVSPDVEGLAIGLTRMIAQARNRAQMGEKLRTFVLAEYAWTSVAAQLKSHLARLSDPTEK